MDQHDLSWAIDQALQDHERRTRRNRFIEAALTGFCANPEVASLSKSSMAHEAIVQADCVIAELDKERT